MSSEALGYLERGAAAMRRVHGVTPLEVYDPRTETTREVTGHYQGLLEEMELEEGGVQLRHSGDAWWSRSETPEPEIGWMVKVSGRILRVRAVADDPEDGEWSVRLEEV